MRKELLFVPFMLWVAPCAALSAEVLLSAVEARTAMPNASDGTRRPVATFELAGETLARGMTSIAWTMPETLAEGWYRLEFTGNAIVPPFEWVSECEDEPYRFRVGNKAKAEDSPVVAFTHEADETARRQAEVFRHSALDVPLTLTRRRADRPVRLAPGQRLLLETRWHNLAVGPLRLQRLEGAVPDLQTTTEVPYHLFDETQPPAFTATLENLGAEPFSGSVEFVWIDALDGEVQRKTRDFVVADDALKLQALLDAPRYGAYTLHVYLRDAAGALVTHQQRHCTYSSRVEARDLPDAWPLAWHLRGERVVPPVGFKWVRIFEGWDEIEKSPGVYDWERFDRNMALARANGHKVLWVFDGVPRHRSSQPKGGQVRGRPRSATGFPPADLADAQGFVGLVLDRYAPGGDASVFAAIEVLNEPMAFITYDGSLYAELCRRVRETVRAKAPAVKLVGISECGGIHMKWINEALDAGAAQHLDIASLHLYEASDPDRVNVKSRLLREALDKRGFPQMRLWNTEVGASSWGRWGGVVESIDAMERRARAAPGFDPKVPYKLGWRWRAQNEFVASCDMVRSAAQELSMGWADKVFLFKWRAGNSSFIHDGTLGGNVVPKLMLPVHAVQAQLWKRYAGEQAENLKLASPDSAYKAFGHRFSGPEGRVTVLYVHPRRGAFVSGDETVADAVGDPLPEAPVEEETNALPGGTPQGVGGTVPELGTALPAYDERVVDIVLPDVRPGAVVMDVLARRQTPVEIDAQGTARLRLSRAPVYLIEPNNGTAWPARRGTLEHDKGHVE